MTTPAHKLQTLAQLDPAYPPFTATLPPHLLTPGPLPPGLAEDMLTLIRAENPALQTWLDAEDTAPQSKFGIDPLTGAVTLSAIIFILQSHFKIDITIKGNHIYFEKKPTDGELMKKILETLTTFLGGKAEK